MTKYIILLVVILASISQVHVPDALGVEVKTLDGISTLLSEQITGELIVLNFWTTEYKPCIRSLSKLVELSEKFDELQVQFVGINEDSLGNINKVKPMVESLNIPYRMLFDVDQALLSELNVSDCPTLVVLNKNGNVLYTHVGFSTGDEVELEHKLIKLSKKD